MKQASKFVTSLAASGVRLAALILSALVAGGAWAVAPTATAVWEGNFETSQGGYSITLPESGMSLSKTTTGNIVVGSDATTGATISLGSDVSKITILIKYSHLYAVSDKKVAIAAMRDNSSNEYALRTSANGGLSLHACAPNGSSQWTVSGNMQTGSGYFLYSYDATSGNGNGTQIGCGRRASSLTAGQNTGLKWTAEDRRISSISIGGPISATDHTYPWAGLVIEKVALFANEIYNATSIAEYEFPTQSRWHDNDTYAFRGAGGSNNTDFHLSTLAPVDAFDSVASDTITLNTSANDASYCWYKFANATLSYKYYYAAPGCALFYDATGYTAATDCSFGPLNIGGLYVTSEQTAGSENSDPVYYSITGSGNRNTELGDPTGKTETYFVFDKSFTIRRSGGSTASTPLYGVVNVEVASGMTFDLNSTPYAGNHSPVSTVLSIAGTTEPVLKLSGDGTFAVSTLDASVGTLDFSGVTSAPMISGNLIVTAETKLVLPAGTAENTAYAVCKTGTITAPSKTVKTSVQVGAGESFTGYVTYNAEAKTVSYSKSAPTYTGMVAGSTITWDVTPTIADLADGNVVLTGSGEVSLDAEPISIDAASGVTVDVAGYNDTVLSGTGTFKFSSGYRTHVPSGMTYQYAGSNDSANPTAIAGVTVDGTLKTSGYVSLTSLVIEDTGTLDVLSESTSVTTSYRNNGAGNLSGNIVVEPDATLINGGTDALDWAGTTRVDIYGTLSMDNTRWSIRQFANCQINLYPGAQVTGAGDDNGVFDLFDSTSKLNMYAGASGGTATIAGPVKLRNSGIKYPIWIESGATLELSGGTLGNGGFSMNGAGELKLSGTMGHSGASLVQDGTVMLDNITTAIPITVNAGKTLAVIATDFETIVPIDATIAATSSIISSSGSGKVSGNIGFSSFSASQLNSNASGTLGAFLSGSSWTGTVTVPANPTERTQRVYLANLGNNNSTIVLNGLSGNTHWIGDGSFPAELKIVGDVTFNNGGSGMNAIIGKVSGTDSTKTLTVAAWANCTGATYTINDLSEYEGAISVNGSNLSSGTFKLVIGNITKASYSYGTALVTCSTTPGTYGTTTIDLSNTTLNNTAANLVFDTDGIYLAEAAYNGVNYKTLASAISDAEAASADPSAVTVYNSSATIPSGYALVTAAGGAMTLRSAGNGGLIYWASSNSGDWSGEDSNGTHTFYSTEGGTSTTPYVTGDTVVFTSDIQIWSKTAAHGAKFQIGTDTAQAEVHFTRSGSDCDNYILDGSEIEVKSDSVLVVERYSDTNPPTQAYTAWDSYQNDNPDESAINDTVISGAGTVKIGGDTGGHGAAAAILSGNSTIADTVTVKFADGATLSVPSVTVFRGSGVVTLDVSDLTLSSSGTTLITFTSAPSDEDIASKMAPSSGAFLKLDGSTLKVYPLVATYNNENYATIAEAIAAAIADSHTYEDVTILDPAATCPDGYYVDTKDNDALKMYQAAIIQNNVGVISTNYFKTAQLAVDAIEANVLTYQNYTHFEVYSGTAVAMTINPSASNGMVWTAFNVKVKCLNDATVAVTLDSTEYELTEGDADANGIVTYTKSEKPTTYVWTGNTDYVWNRPANWAVGTASGATASRSPSSVDTAAVNGSASITVTTVSVAGLQVSGAVTFTGVQASITSASPITLGANDTISLTGVTLSPEPTTNVSHSRVKTVTVDGTTTYSVELIPGTTFTVY